MTSDDDLLRMAEEAGFVAINGSISIDYDDYTPEIKKLAELVESAVRERIAVIIRGQIQAARYHFTDPARRDAADRVLLDLLDEVVAGEEPQPDPEVYTPPPPTPEQLRIRENQRLILAGAMRARP